jgi:predicted PurR-regulated permease PerM
MADNKPKLSPQWGSNSKLIVGLSIVFTAACLFIAFRDMLGPLLVAFILIYLLYPVIKFGKRILKISWAVSVNIVFLIMIGTLLGLITWGGITLVNQVINLFNFLQSAIVDLPSFINSFVIKNIEIGPFTINLGKLDTTALANQLISVVQPVLVGAKDLVSSFASGAASMLGWLFFEVIISYFVLCELEQKPGQSISLPVPGYRYDFERMRLELEKIWDAFLRGQITIISLIILLYLIVLGPLGLSYFYALAFVAGLARFVPYIGTTIAWLSFGLVAFFQGYTAFGMEPLPYSLLVVGIVITVDTLFDNLVSQRIMAKTLKVHPALVLIFALMGFTWFGIIGVILAAPVLATLRLFTFYAIKKLFDQDPWEGLDVQIAHSIPRSLGLIGRITGWIKKIIKERLKR